MSRRVIGIFLCMVLAIVQVQFLGTVSASAATVQSNVAICNNVVNSEHSLKINRGLAPKHKLLNIISEIENALIRIGDFFIKIKLFDKLFCALGILIGCAIGWIAIELSN